MVFMSKNRIATVLSIDERNYAREIWLKESDSVNAEKLVLDYLKSIGKHENFDECMELFTGESLSVSHFNDTETYLFNNTLYGSYINRKPRSQRSKLNEDVINVFKRLHVRRSIVNTGNSPEENHYGLVVGKVQSGKTAHMLGLAAIALDGRFERQLSDINLEENYFQTEIVVILSGLIDDLRIQTSKRFKSDFDIDDNSNVFFGPRDKDDLCGDKVFQEELKSILVKSREESESLKKIIIIIKKNHTILDKLTEIIQDSFEDGYDQEFPGSWLIIDDECDYASQDKSYSSLKPGSNETATNESLRRLIQTGRDTSSGEVWYVGYTATPFSNILANPNATTTDLGPDLFPSGFISLVDPPDAHFDNSYYFNDGIGLEKHYICIDNENYDTVLRQFVLMHCLTYIIKKIRKLDIHHSSMVHLARTKIDHVQTLRDIREIISQFKHKTFREDMESTLKSNFNHLSKTELELVKKYIHDLDENGIVKLYQIELIELNRRNKSIENPDEYSQEKEKEFPEEIIYKDGNPRNIIITGGDRISRGLTLEGLTVSLFQRTAKKPSYDTMLQMARWNGYRSGYEDLVRIMTTQDIADDFRKISIAETDMRNQIRRMTDKSDPVTDIIQLFQFSGLKVTGSMPAKEFLNWYSVVNPYFISDKTYLTHPPELVNNESAFAIVDDFIECIDLGNSFSHPPKSPKSKTYRVSANNDQDEVIQFLTEYLDLYKSETINSKIELDNLLKSMGSKSIDYSWNIAYAVTPSATPKYELMIEEEIGMGLRTPKTNDGFDPIYTNFEEASEVDLDVNEIRNNALLLIYFVNPAKISSFNLKVPVPLLMFILPKPEGVGGYSGVRVGGHRPPSLTLKSLLEEE
jgi:hypothetical protein